MPGGDKTGPEGMGPMTGRAAGLCVGYPTPGCANLGGGRGFGGGGRGRGRGRGRRNRFYATGLTGWQRAAIGDPAFDEGVSGVPLTAAPAAAPISREEKLDTLKKQAQHLELTLTSVQKRIEELDATINQE